MQKSLRCKDSRLGFGILILFGISLVIPKFRITRLSAWPGQEGALVTPEELCSLKLPDWLRPDTLRISSWKMYPVCLAIHGARPTRQSSTRWTDWGMVWNGNVLTAKILASRSQETACTLSDILMSDVEEKYFLSPKQQEVLLFKPTAVTKENESTPPKD